MSSTRPSSPVPREGPPFVVREEDVSLVYPNGWTSSAYQPLHDGREDMSRDKSPHLDVTLESNCAFLKGTGVDVEPAFLTGQVALTLTEPTSLKEITLQFRGKARLPVPANESILNNVSVASYVVCNHDWSFLEGNRKHSHTLKAGRHTFPFQLRIGGSLPSSISTHDGNAEVAYRLRAQATRPGFSCNLHANVPILVVRSFGPDALEYQQTLEIENTWPEKLMYSIMLPHKAWAVGDAVTALVKFSPLSKGSSVLRIATSLHESTSVHARSGSQDHTRILASVRHSILNGKAVLSDGNSSAGSSSSSGSGLNLCWPWESNQVVEDQTPSVEDDSLRENNDVVANITISIPSSTVPAHAVEPILISHRIRWTILIANLDGHTSELRCSLPIHVLDGRLLQEAKRYTAATRRLLIGGPELSPEGEEEMELPSYTSHVRDLIADLGPTDVTCRGTSNASASLSPTPPLTPDRGMPIQSFPRFPSGYSTPLEPDPFSHLPHVPESGDSVPLEWVNSELLSGQRYRSRRRPVFHMADETTESDHSRPTSRPASRYPSRPPSRSASPDRTNATTNNNNNGNTHCHPQRNDSHNQNHRNLHGLLKATMKPFTSITHSNWLSKAGSHGNFNDLPDQHAVHGYGRHSHSRPYPCFSQSPQSSHSPQAIPVSLLPTRRDSQLSHHPTPEPPLGFFLPRALTEVPDYDAASRTGFMVGVPPLTSLQGLPSYEEAAMDRMSASSSSTSSEPPDPSVSDSPGVNLMDVNLVVPPRPAFGPAQRTRSEPDLVTRIAGLSWGLSARRL